MLAMLVRKLVFTFAVVFVIAGLLERFDPNPLPLYVDAGFVRSDYPLCVTAKPPPLLRSPESQVDYRLGQPFNDKGIS